MNYVLVKSSECKGCQLCVQDCPKHCFFVGSEINEIGYQYAHFIDRGCTACGICFYVCPEPGAITVYKNEEKSYEETVDQR